ncbi:MAG: hypothetical protein WCN98_15545, partial [Verrucomicrobiaceae bacterium]
ILGLLENGFLTDSSRFSQLEIDLTATLHRARDFGSEYGAPDDRNTIWRQRWDNVECILRRIHLLVAEMDDAILSSENDRLKKALTSWETIQTEDSHLVDALNGLRTQALLLNPTSRHDWNTLAQTLDAHVETIHSCSQAFRAKLELLKEHSKEEVDIMVKNLIAQLPSRATAQDASAAAYALEYDQAVVDLHREQHQSVGLLDAIKTMFMWMDSPDERVSKNRSFRIDPT